MRLLQDLAVSLYGFAIGEEVDIVHEAACLYWEPYSFTPLNQRCQQPICKVDILLIQALTIVSTPYIDVTFRSWLGTFYR